MLQNETLHSCIQGIELALLFWFGFLCNNIGQKKGSFIVSLPVNN